MNEKEVEKLASEIKRHKQFYYSGMSEISDEDYDLLEEKLKKVSPHHPVLSLVGYKDASIDKPKIAHSVPMLSLDKTYDPSGVAKWAKDQALVGMLKIDGSSLHLDYQNGQLMSAVTRGDGRYGEDVSDRVSWVADIPLKTSRLDRFSVRGELYCPEESFFELVQTMKNLGLETPTSTRNIVAGLLGRKAYHYLLRYTHFYAFDLLETENSLLRYESEKIVALQELGFAVPTFRLCETAKDIDEFTEYAKKVGEEADFGIDGIVFVLNDLSTHQKLGVTSHHPRFKMAFKWAGETATTHINEILWATSRLGIVTPVAQVEPVILSGAKIANVSLHNAQFVRSFSLAVGDEIEIVRSGEVIPKFLRVISHGPAPLVLPSECPSCQSVLVDDGIRLRCHNLSDCPAQLLGRIMNWIQAVEIMDLSDKRLQQLIDANLVEKVSDLYQLKKEDLLELPQFKEKMASKLIQRISQTRELDLAVFLNGLGIEGMGRNSWEKLIAGLEGEVSLERIQSLEIQEITPILGFAEKTAEQIVIGLQQCSELIESLLLVGLELRTASPSLSNLPLRGKTFVITGSLSRPRSEYEEAIKKLGGKLAASVSQKTTSLVIEDLNSTSSKAVKAKELNIPLWTEDQLMAMLSSLSSAPLP